MDNLNFVLIIATQSQILISKGYYGACLLYLCCVNQFHYSLLYVYQSVSIIDLFKVNIMSEKKIGFKHGPQEWTV